MLSVHGAVANDVTVRYNSLWSHRILAGSRACCSWVLIRRYQALYSYSVVRIRGTSLRWLASHLERLEVGTVHMCLSSVSGYRPLLNPPPSLGNLFVSSSDVFMHRLSAYESF